ncbi:MAG: nucleotidyl transferase AbiEii/AbiGii toxin family protein [Candidatus Desantisbacteria bacterium]
MFEEAISEGTRKDLAILVLSGILSPFYLAGGTGCSLQIGHRLSYDLDLFTQETFDTKALMERLSGAGKFLLEDEADQTIIGMFCQTRISFFRYPYPVLFPPKGFKGLSVADIRDIGCMKLDAISSRGSRRDFVDLYFISKEIGDFKMLLELFKEKYQGIDYNLVHILKSLVWFDDAEKEPMPKMLKGISWEEIKSFFRKEAKKVM